MKLWNKFKPNKSPPLLKTLSQHPLMNNTRSNNKKRPQLEKMKKPRLWRSSSSKLNQDLRQVTPNLKLLPIRTLLNRRMPPPRVNQQEKKLPKLARLHQQLVVNSQMLVHSRIKTTKVLQALCKPKFHSKWLAASSRPQLVDNSKNESWSLEMTFLLNMLTVSCAKFKMYTTLIWKLHGNRNLKNS
jgi:hypothetical protein